MKNILALLLLIGVSASADVIKLPLLSGPLVFSNSASAINLTPTNVGSVTLYYTNSLGQVVIPNGTSNLVSGVWTNSWSSNYVNGAWVANTRTWPTVLPSIAMVPVKAADYVSLSVALARSSATNGMVLRLSKSYDGVRFTTTNVVANFDTTFNILIPAHGVTNNHNFVISTNIAGTWFTGVKAIRLDSIDLAAGNAAAGGPITLFDVSASTITASP